MKTPLTIREREAYIRYIRILAMRYLESIGQAITRPKPMLVLVGGAA